MARTSTGELVCINEESSVWITRVKGQHSVVDKLLGALGLVAGGQESAGTVGEQTGLQSGGLGVVVVTISISVRNVLENDSPVALNIDSAGDLGIVNIRGTEVSLRSNPVGSVILAWSLGCSGVVAVVKVFLLRLGNAINKVISRLVSNVSILLEEESILGDLSSNVIGWILLVNDTVGKVRSFSTLGWGLGVTVAISGSMRGMGGRGVVGHGPIGGRGVWGGMVHWGVVDKLVCPYYSWDQHKAAACNQF